MHNAMKASIGACAIALTFGVLAPAAIAAPPKVTLAAPAHGADTNAAARALAFLHYRVAGKAIQVKYDRYLGGAKRRHLTGLLTEREYQTLRLTLQKQRAREFELAHRQLNEHLSDLGR